MGIVKLQHKQFIQFFLLVLAIESVFVCLSGEFRCLPLLFVDHRSLSIPNEKRPKQIPSIAFIFITGDNLNEDVWANWFPPPRDPRFSVVVHTKPSHATVDLGPYFCPHAIPSVPSAWYELFEAMMQALRYAHKQDLHAQQFVFLSSTSIPLRPFDHVYDKLILRGDIQKSRFCWMGRPDEKWQHVAGPLGIPLEDTRKAEMWSILGRSQVEILLENEPILDEWNRVMKQTRRIRRDTFGPGQRVNVGAPDELILATFLYRYAPLGGDSFFHPYVKAQGKLPLGVRNGESCSHYVSWNLPGTQPLLRLPLINRTVPLSDEKCNSNSWPCIFRSVNEEALLELQQSGYLFLRKIWPDTQMVMMADGHRIPVHEGLAHMGITRSGTWVTKIQDANAFLCPAPRNNSDTQ